MDSLLPSLSTDQSSSPFSLLHKPGRARGLARRSMLVALMVSTVASGMPGLSHAGESVAQKLADPGPVAEQQAQVASPTAEQSGETSAWQTLKDISDTSYQTEVGGYQLSVEAFGSRFKARPRVKLDEASLKGTARIDLANTELSRTREVDGWQISDGAYGRVRLTGEYRTGVEKGGEATDSFEHGAALEFGLFRRWETSLSDSVNFEHRVEAGYSYNMTHGDTAATVGARQTLRGESEWRGHDYTWTVEARQRVSYDSSPEGSGLKGDVEVFAGVGKSFPMQVFGRDSTVEATVGPRFRADTLGNAKVSPAAHVRVRF